MQRAFTPPIVPPSKVVQQQRAAAAAAAPQGPPQVLSLGGPNRGEEMVDLVLTTPLQGDLFRRMRKKLHNVDDE